MAVITKNQILADLAINNFNGILFKITESSKYNYVLIKEIEFSNITIRILPSFVAFFVLYNSIDRIIEEAKKGTNYIFNVSLYIILFAGLIVYSRRKNKKVIPINTPWLGYSFVDTERIENIENKIINELLEILFGVPYKQTYILNRIVTSRLELLTDISVSSVFNVISETYYMDNEMKDHIYQLNLAFDEFTL
jgi:hypothetical protein